MSDMMAVLLNGIAQLEYDRGKPLPEHQALYLEKIDMKMDQAIQIDNINIENPDLAQRIQFISANLAHAIKDGDEAMSAALCSWLATRIPDLKQVKIDDKDNVLNIELVYDEEYRKQVEVKFFH